jgi:PAS domain S-box-containing protein
MTRERDPIVLTPDQSAAMLDALVQSAPVGVAFLDRELRYVKINEALARLNGVSVDEHIGRTIGEVLPEVAEVAVPMFQRVLETGEPLIGLELSGETPAAPGEQRYWHETVYPVTNTDDEITGVGAIVVDVTERKLAEQALRDAQLRRGVIAHLATAQEAERKRIASDIHDDVVQGISSVVIRLERIEDAHPEASGELAEARKEIAGAVRRLRGVIFSLRPPALDLAGLADAVRLYLDEQRREWGLEYEFDASLASEPSEDVRVLLYRVAQEAVTNVRRHSGTTCVHVTLADSDSGVLLTIADEGSGPPPKDPKAGTPMRFGLATMRERAEAANGWWRIGSADGGGTLVSCWVPSG